jgi:hypothetical protein
MFGFQLIRQHRKVRVYLQDGPTIEGVLASRTRSEYVLWAPRIITGEHDPEVEVSGHVEIPRERVLWYQIVG